MNGAVTKLLHMLHNKYTYFILGNITNNRKSILIIPFYLLFEQCKKLISSNNNMLVI